MLFRQIIHEDLGCASYLVGDPGSGAAAVVDPQWDIDPYLQLARLHGARIEHVLETHNHADHVSGHGRLARASGATIHVNRLAEAEYEHEPFDDGWALALGEEVAIEALHTPGHRPEHTSFLLRDGERGGDPVAVLSGDSLFVGDVARPDLAIEPRDGAAGIFRSLHERLLALPDEVEALLKIVTIKGWCRTANVEKVDAGPKGIVLTFRDNAFPNPAALVRYISEQGSFAKLRPDHKLVISRDWGHIDDRMKGTAVILAKLAKLADVGDKVAA